MIAWAPDLAQFTVLATLPADPRSASPLLAQGLLLWLSKGGFKVCLGTVGGIEAALALTLIFLKDAWEDLKNSPPNSGV